MSFSVTWLGQGGYMVKINQSVVCLDPYLSNQVERKDGLTRIAPPPTGGASIDADIIVLSHDHMDHLDEWTLRDTDFSLNLYAGPQSCRSHLLAMGVPQGRILPLDRLDTLQMGDLELIAVHAEHTDDSIGLVVRGDGLTAYFTADTLLASELDQVGQMGVDAVFACINGRWGNMDAAQAAQLTLRLKARLGVPAHYGMFAENTADPADYVRALDGKTAAKVLTIGQTLDLHQALGE